MWGMANLVCSRRICEIIRSDQISILGYFLCQECKGISSYVLPKGSYATLFVLPLSEQAF